MLRGLVGKSLRRKCKMENLKEHWKLDQKQLGIILNPTVIEMIILSKSLHILEY